MRPMVRGNKFISSSMAKREKREKEKERKREKEKTEKREGDEKREYKVNNNRNGKSTIK